MELTPDKWSRAKALFDEVLQHAPADRDLFLLKACPEVDVRAQIEELLRNHAEAANFLSKPIFEGCLNQERPKDYASGTIVDSRFKIVRFLDRGGMGEVFEAEDLKLRRQVALKFLPSEMSGDPLMIERFAREARAASALDHPNICTIYETGEHDNRPFIAMQYLEGETLRDHIKDEPLSTDMVVDLGIQIADALDAAHSKGIIHRDVKPANIFLTTRGQVKVLDFGLAKCQRTLRYSIDGIRPSSPSTLGLPEDSLTYPGSILGTIAYMSPEQVRGEELDSRTDLFSFGAML